MKKSIIDFLNKNRLIIAIIILVIGFVIYAALRELKIANDAYEKAKLELQIGDLQDRRDALQAENIQLLSERDRLQKQKDSIKAVQDKQKSYYEYVIRKNKKEIDSLMNIPDDTVYVRLQPIYPNPAQEPLLYPFSGSQIRQIYFTAISYPRLQTEYSLQTNLLTTCNNLNKKYQDSEKNYEDIVNNLNKNITICNQQTGLKDEQLKITQKELDKKKFWNWTQKGIIAAAAALLIIK